MKNTFHEAAILARVVGPDEPHLSPATARALLKLGFNRVDQERMHQLTVRAKAGTLTDEEQTQIEAYSRISSLLGILKSRARRALKRSSANGGTR